MFDCHKKCHKNDSGSVFVLRRTRVYLSYLILHYANGFTCACVVNGNVGI